MAPTAVIAGVGPGLGESLARAFAADGYDVGLFARSGDYLADLADDLREAGHGALGVPTDLTDPDHVARGFDRVREELGPVDVLVNHAGGGGWRGLRNLPADEFADAWRTCALSGFLCSKQALDDVLDRGGTIIFTGATSAVRGRADALGFASAKFAVRGMAESMARELGPEGVHVAHVVIDGQILPPDGPAPDRDTESYLDPDAVADSYLHLVHQDESAWTLELDLRPNVESF
ncbi:SDR family NAD(P)-dependent oxidoreductase [Halobacteriaceae archaeon GCM10025711]